jgi:hypothetical protein
MSDLSPQSGPKRTLIRSLSCVLAAGQAHRKDRTFTRLARHGHVTAHHARELPGDGKPEPRPAEALSGRRIGLAELLEQLGLLLSCNWDGARAATCGSIPAGPLLAMFTDTRQNWSRSLGLEVPPTLVGPTVPRRGTVLDSFCHFPHVNTRLVHISHKYTVGSYISRVVGRCRRRRPTN